MSKLFEVEIVVRAVIVADDLNHAFIVAEDEARTILREETEREVDVSPIPTIEHLPAGWDGDCFPYGQPAVDKRIKHILDEIPPEAPTPDTKTIDMFAEQPV